METEKKNHPPEQPDDSEESSELHTHEGNASPSSSVAMSDVEAHNEGNMTVRGGGIDVLTDEEIKNLIDQLEDRRTQAEENAEYIEADVANRRIVKLKRVLERRRSTNIKINQAEEQIQYEQRYNDELKGFQKKCVLLISYSCD